MGLILLMFLIAGIDLGIKAEIEARDSSEFPKPLAIAKGKIILHKSHNTGLPFEVLKSYPDAVKKIPMFVFSGLSGIFGFLLPKKGFWAEKIALALTLGGAFSNLFDRCTRNYVVDYFSVEVKGIKKIIFNLGDICIFLGAIIMVVSQIVREITWRMKKKKA